MTVWKKGGLGWYYVNLDTGSVLLNMTNAEYRERQRKNTTTQIKETTSDHRIEDKREESTTGKKSFNFDNIFDNKNIDDIVKGAFIFIIFKIILGVFK